MSDPVILVLVLCYAVSMFLDCWAFGHRKTFRLWMVLPYGGIVGLILYGTDHEERAALNKKGLSS